MVATATMTQTISPRQHKLRTYVVLNAKSSRGRLASFTDALDDASAASPTFAAKASAWGAPERVIPDECLAYESYAAVASRFQASPSTSPTRDLRWSDISRPRLHLAPLVSAAATANNANNAKSQSQKARQRQLRRARSASGTPNGHLECHALELCFEFLDVADLQTATAVCSEFRDVVTTTGRLLVGLYARKWRAAAANGAAKPAPMARSYVALAYKPLLAMVTQRRADVAYALTTRSQTTMRSDATVEIVNNSLLRVLERSTVDSVRGVAALPELSCARALGQRVSYFEVAMHGCGSVGVVSLSDAETRRAYGYGSDEHVGWKGVAFGYHGNDGDFVFNDGAAPYGGLWKPYGPSWGNATSQDVVGCGLNLASRQLFFTLNGTFLGFAPVAVPAGEFAAAVSLHGFNDRAILNAGSAPFRFDIEGFCASP